MLNPHDLYSFQQTVPLMNATKVIGQAILHYQIRQYKDLSSLDLTPKYQVLGTVRVIIPNGSPFAIGPQNVVDYQEYPAALSCSVDVKTATTSAAANLVRYNPKTINSAVVTTHSDGSSGSSAVSHQHTSGSSTSQSNTFGTSATVGFFADMPTGSVTASYSQTSESGQSQSRGSGNSSSSSEQQSSGDSMTVKDWACNTYVDPGNSTPTWIWGQEYPWNVLKYNNAQVANPTVANPIILPTYVQARMADSTYALPPSDLSLFGIDFTMKALWIVTPDSSGEINISHTLGYSEGMHSYQSAYAVSAALSKPISFTPAISNLDLISYALDPLSSGRSGYSAVIGFVPSKFLTPPTPASASGTGEVPFQIVSAYNDLYLKDTSTYTGLTASDAGAGFVADQTGLVASFTEHCQSLVITGKFKLTDLGVDYVLHMKHWKVGNEGFQLTFVFNGDPATSVTRYVDAKEAEGGDANTLSISLRDQDYESVDCHDYLQLGMNTVEIEIKPIGTAGTTGQYKIRALAINRG